MGKSLETGLVLKALDFAMKKVGPDAEIIFHSDRGSQYASKAYRDFLEKKNIKPRMSRRGNCYGVPQKYWTNFIERFNPKERRKLWKETKVQKNLQYRV